MGISIQRNGDTGMSQAFLHYLGVYPLLEHDLACREIATELKVSFHQSGFWSIAFTDRMWSQPDSFIDRPANRSLMIRHRPAPFSPGFTMAFKIITPAAAANIPVESKLDNLVAISIPSADKAIG
jgi:hypothetical protein